MGTYTFIIMFSPFSFLSYPFYCHKSQKQCHYICPTNYRNLWCFVHQKSSGHIQFQSLFWNIEGHVMAFCWFILHSCTNFSFCHCTIWIWTYEKWIYMGQISSVCSLCINHERLECLTQSIFIQMRIHSVSNKNT